MMRNGLLIGGVALLATVILAPIPTAAQKKASPPARTPDGKPNLEGIYSFSTITPLQRPKGSPVRIRSTTRRPRRSKRRKTRGSIATCFDPIKGQPSAW